MAGAAELERIEAALGAMGARGPKDLLAYLTKPGPDFSDATASQLRSLIDVLLQDDPNSLPRLKFSHLLREWDNTKDAVWTADTRRNTPDRRQRIHDQLKVDAALAKRIDALIPFFRLEEPLIISKEHTDWYEPLPGRDYYWTTYTKYLRERRGWDDVSVLSLDNTTRSIVECMADPESPGAYRSRGLVMGYVQSGKTANFTGVVARA